MPDVFAFLKGFPGLGGLERLDVVLVDQAERWKRGQPLPLRVYLSAFPDIAAHGELIRALADRDREQRRLSASRLNDTPAVYTADRISQAKTQPIEVESQSHDTEPDQDRLRPDEPVTRELPTPAHDLVSTRGMTSAGPTDERLSFALDEVHHLQSEAESLRTMLDAVRFTLVRRVGRRRHGGRLRGVRPAARRAGGFEDDAACRPRRARARSSRNSVP